MARTYAFLSLCKPVRIAHVGFIAEMTRDEIILENTLRLADHHRAHCDGEACDISLSFLLELLERAGINIPPDCAARFI